MTTMSRIYTVVALDGSTKIDACGHKHRSYDAAERCRDKLRNRRCAWCGSRSRRYRCLVGGGGHSMVESARWYHARIDAHPNDHEEE